MDLNQEQQYRLRVIHNNFTGLIKNIKANTPWGEQQKKEFSLPSYEMFEALLASCIQDKDFIIGK